MKKFTIQIDYTEEVDGNHKRIRSCYHVDADNISEAYEKAGDQLNGLSKLKLGAIMPGHIVMAAA